MTSKREDLLRARSTRIDLIPIALAVPAQAGFDEGLGAAQWKLWRGVLAETGRAAPGAVAIMSAPMFIASASLPPLRPL